MSKHDPMVRLKHMHGFAKKAVELAGNRTHADILNDEVLMLAITHLIELVGEAASWISEEDRGKYPTIPWKNRNDHPTGGRSSGLNSRRPVTG